MRANSGSLLMDVGRSTCQLSNWVNQMQSIGREHKRVRPWVTTCQRAQVSPSASHIRIPDRPKLIPQAPSVCSGAGSCSRDMTRRFLVRAELLPDLRVFVVKTHAPAAFGPQALILVQWMQQPTNKRVR